MHYRRSCKRDSCTGKETEYFSVANDRLQRPKQSESSPPKMNLGICGPSCVKHDEPFQIIISSECSADPITLSRASPANVISLEKRKNS